MNNRTLPPILQNIDSEVAELISKSRNISDMDALRLFWDSKTHEMLSDNALRLWHFSPLAIFDLWESEQATGDPRNSLYHVEAIENAYMDLDSLIATGKPAW